MQVTRSEDGQKIVLSFLESSGLNGDIALDEAQLTQLITSLGLARTALVEKSPQHRLKVLGFLLCTKPTGRFRSIP